MERTSARVLCILGLLALQGCAVVSSVKGAHGGEGVAYMLPRALLPVELVYGNGAYELRITEPVVVGDPDHAYTLQRSGNVFTSDTVTVSVDAATGLLSAVDVKSEDKTLPALIQLATGLKAEAADAATSVVVFRGFFDPGWSEEEVQRFNSRLSHAAASHVARLSNENACTPAATAEACKGIRTLAGLSLNSFAVAVEGGTGAAFAAADCTAGLCYRLNVPHVVTLSGPGSSSSAVFGLPNRSPTYVLPLERWAFVKTSHDVKFEGGVFKSITTDRPSSALAVASAPLDVAKAAFSAASELIQLKIDLSGKEEALAKAKVAKIEADAALEKALLDKAGGGKEGDAEAAILGKRPRKDAPLLSIRVGQASQLDATANLVGVGMGKQKEPRKDGQNPAEASSTGKSSSAHGGSGN